jgi:hypothetical protein
MNCPKVDDKTVFKAARLGLSEEQEMKPATLMSERASWPKELK